MPFTPEQRAIGRRISRRRGTPQRLSATQDSRNRVSRVLDALSTGQFALAGIFEESQRRASGLPARSLSGVVKRAIRERRSFTELTDSFGLGLMADFVVDPLNLVAIGAPTRAIASFARATRLTKGLKKLDDITEGISSLRRAKLATIKTFGGRGAELKRQNPRKLFENQNKLIDDVDGVVPGIAEDFNEEMMRLVPDPERRGELFLLAGDRPVSPQQAKRLGLAPNEIPANLRSKGTLEFQQRLANLSAEERKAFELSSEFLEVMETQKLKFGRLDQARAANFIKVNGTNYVPWRQATKEHVLTRLREIEKGLAVGDEAVETFKLDDVREAIKNLEGVDELNSLKAQNVMRDYYGGKLGADPAFLKPRTRGGPVSALADINTDIAAVLASEAITVGRMASVFEYVKSLSKFVDDSGLAFDKSLAGSPQLKQSLIAKLGVKEGTKRFREGMVPIKDLSKLPKEVSELFAGKIVPKSIAGEIGTVVAKYTDEDFVEAFFQTYAKVQNFWKAWTLSIFPAYHARNVLSNFWNNALAGMDIIDDPKVIQDYRLGWQILWAQKHGKLDDTIKVFQGKTQKQLWKELRDNRVTRGGQFTGELGQIMGRHISKDRLIRGIIDPRPQKNLAVQFGFRTGTLLEDHARVSHALWRMRKGDDIKQAAQSVHKFLFDYKYGLSEIESKLFRNFLMPFYAWTRFNLPLQVEMLVHAPRRFNRVGKAIRLTEDQFGGPEPNEIFLADWMKQALSIRWRYNKEKGTYQYFLLDSWLPVADLEKLFSGREFKDALVNLWSPLQKVPIELLFNYNQFTKRKIREFPGQRKKLIGVTIPTPASAKIAHFLRNIRVLNEIDRLLQAHDRDGWLSVIWRTLGLKSYPADFQKQKKRWTFDIQKRVRFAKSRLSLAKKRGERKNIELLERAIALGEQNLKENK